MRFFFLKYRKNAPKLPPKISQNISIFQLRQKKTHLFESKISMFRCSKNSPFGFWLVIWVRFSKIYEKKNAPKSPIKIHSNSVLSTNYALVAMSDQLLTWNWLFSFLHFKLTFKVIIFFQLSYQTHVIKNWQPEGKKVRFFFSKWQKKTHLFGFWVVIWVRFSKIHEKKRTQITTHFFRGLELSKNEK